MKQPSMTHHDAQAQRRATSMKTTRSLLVPVLCGVALVACRDPESAAEAPRSAAAPLQARAGGLDAPAAVVDAVIEPRRRELLELAYEAASKFPTFVHGKNRGRAQELVLEACFELGQPLLGLRFAPDAEGYRRGMAYADFAYHSARQGVTAGVERYLALADQVVAEASAVPNQQQWRVDKVKLKVARALAALGEVDAAAERVGAIGASSRGAVDRSWSATIASRVEDMTVAEAQADLETITDSFTSQSLGEQYSSLLVLSALHGRFFDESKLRAAVEERLLERFEKLPADLRLDAIAPLVGHYVAHEDLDGARDVIVTMARIVDGANWRLEHKLPELARIAELHVDTGDTERARQELEQALAAFHAGRDGVVGIYRCEALRPVALGYYKLGDREQAEGLLAMALEEGAQNPNARPRCDDLVETCVAMALRGVQPSAALQSQLREMCDGLKDPW